MTIRITIVTFAWPPRNSIGAHRPLSWAKYWSEAGASVQVLTAKKYSYDAPLDLPMPELPGVKVIEVNYRTNLTSFAAIVLRSPVGRFVRKYYNSKRKGSTYFPNPREQWLDAALPIAREIALNTDVVVSTYDPRSVHQIGAAMKMANPNLIWAADYRDLWSLNHAPNWSSEQRGEEQGIEAETVGAYADLVSSVSVDLSQKQGEHVNKPWIAVTNGFDINLSDIKLAVSSKMRRARKKEIKVVYTGKIYQGLRDPLPLFKVICELEAGGLIEKGSISVHIYGGKNEGLDEIMASRSYDHFVRIHGHVTREVAIAAQRSADLLLLLESPLSEARGVLTGKLFEYIGSAVPIISLGSRKDSAIGEILDLTGTGICTEDDPILIRNTLLDFLGEEDISWYSPNFKKIANYSREAQASRFLERLQDVFVNRNA